MCAVDVLDKAQEELIRLVKVYDEEADFDLLRKAFQYARIAHEGQMRASGEPYLIHPLEVAKVLAGLHLDTNTISAALLHDILEDTQITYDDLKASFGEEIASLVDGVTKLSAISANERKDSVSWAIKERKESQAENLRKIFIAMARDIRVILIKLADRLHNLRTLSSLPALKRKFIAKETLEIFAPITSRLGLWRLKWEIEDLAFSYLEPENYRNLVQRVAKRRAEREKVIEGVIETIRKKLEELHISAHIEGRPKHLYSIYQKMAKRGKEFSEIYDLFALRIIVNSVEECYASLGAIHGLWMPIKDRIKDYIAMPKANNYKSLHTSVYGPGNEPLEIQIRTWEMHRVDEYGVAAHWAYKEGKRDINLVRDIFPWIQRITELQGETKSAAEYVKNLKLDLLESQVFVFTPKGDVIGLPAGSTPIDFAYRIHTDVGHRCAGAKVNAKIVSIDYQLQNGDIADIITSKHGTPSLDWLKVCKSSHAKNKIRQWFKKERRDENIVRGREILERELKRNRLEGFPGNEKIMKQVTAELNFLTFEDLLASIGYGENTPAQIITRIKEELPKEEAEEIEALIKKPVARKQKTAQAVKVKGIDNLLVKFSKCCLPVPGDSIIGYITMGKGISVHRVDCPNMVPLTSQKERIIDVEWDSRLKEYLYTVELELDAWDRPGLLSEVMNMVNEMKISARSCKAWAKKDAAVIKLCIDVTNKAQLEDLMKKLAQIKNIMKVKRITHTL
ncbi:MAG: bifunctional (p)ppGpp synthetase/guanosine-3',5'-bis(diphosphate) 3'-pyrophosphohydrolase [Firmicutes bacterium]|nr:bifunctional (p)ppGpp synthetase/guanosine-3',5'-bis(diphosphate) 3'-pyrophosphohydrolase [Bacillota bacterium]